MPFLRRPPDLFGLDVGSSAVKVLQLRETAGGGGHALIAFGVAALPPQAVVDGVIREPATVVEAIRQAAARAGVKGTTAAVAVCGRELIIKKVQIPQVPPHEVADVVALEAEHHISFAIDEVFLDHHVIGRHDGVLDLVLVAVKKSKVTEYTAVVEQAGFIPVVVDVDTFALANQHELNHPEHSAEVVALIDLGASVMKTNVLHGRATIFARDIPFGGFNYTRAIAERLSIPHEKAEAAKLGRDVGVPWESVVPALEAVSRELSLEVQRTFDYFASTAESERIARIVLSGGCAKLPGLTEYLSSNWGIPVEVARPLDHVDVDPMYAEDVAREGPALAVAVGLALRRPGDRDA
jgi:type IV pilus assembly protein PilM